MNFQVPQFQEVEDKIFGPFTFKQFIFLGGGGALMFLTYLLPLPLFIKILPMGIIGAVAGAMAFYKVNNRPLTILMGSALKYQTGGKLYLWQRKPTKNLDISSRGEKPSAEKLIVEKLSSSKLKDLAWSLDIKKTTR